MAYRRAPRRTPWGAICVCHRLSRCFVVIESPSNARIADLLLTGPHGRASSALGRSVPDGMPPPDGGLPQD